jgi:predicted transposase YdaD
MEACEQLKEYSWFVDRVRVLMDGKTELEAAVDKALGEMPGSFILKAFLLANRAEIKGMFLEDYNIETFKRDMRAEGYEEGLEDGRKEGREDGRKEGLEDGRKEGLEEGRKDITARMLKEGLPVSLIAKISTLPESAIMDLAAKLNVGTKDS